MEPPTKRLKSTDVGKSEQVEPVFSEKLVPNLPAAGPVPSGAPSNQHKPHEMSFNSKWQALVVHIMEKAALASGLNANAAGPRTHPCAGDTEPLTESSSDDDCYPSVDIPVGPEVQFGEHAQAPRWLIEPVSPQSQQENDLLVHQATQTNAKTATLAWSFDAGPSSQWKSLGPEQLAEYAYKYLENALEDPVFRDSIRLAIVTGSHAEIVGNVEDPLPSLPPAPTTNYFGPPLGTPSIFNDKTYFYFTHKRPSVAMQPGILRPIITPIDGPVIGGRISPIDLRRGPQTALNGGNSNPQMIGNDAGVEQPISKDYPNGLSTVDPGEFRQHAKTKRTNPKSSNPHPAASLKLKPAATNNNLNGNDGDKPRMTKNMQLEYGLIKHLENPTNRAKNFPRYIFRRMRPWAGFRVSEEFFSQDDLDRLPQFPSVRRAFYPRVEANAPVASDWGSPPSQGPRRNPRRGCQNS